MPKSSTPREPTSSEITSQALYVRRRELMKNLALGAGTAAAVGTGLMALLGGADRPNRKGGPQAQPLPIAGGGARKPTYDVPDEARTSFESITTYNNYYELGTEKSDPAENAGSLRLRPWTIEVSGEVKKPLTLDIESLLKWFPLEERVYRMRCVEAWSMVIPWLGFPLRDLIHRLEPTSNAKFVTFTTLLDPAQLPGQREETLDWPYVEALRIDEAMHPLALMAVGLYGKTLLGQNGAPIRLVVPWKYGFKGIKSIVKIELVKSAPPTTWSYAAPGEYGFYANVNPEVDHPRWSQRTERRIGELERRITLPFNGYGAEVARLYTGLDLKRYF